VCHYLGLTPSERLFERLSAHLAQLPFREDCPAGFALYLARLRLTPFRTARLDLATRLLFPRHPARHVLNAVIALHECDGRGFRELDSAPTGLAVWPALIATGVRFALSALVTSAWLVWQWSAYVSSSAMDGSPALRKRRVLITGTGSGLGRDLMLHCLERGATVVGTVRTEQSRGELAAQIPSAAPLKIVVADFARPGEIVAALRSADVDPRAVDIAIACAGVKYLETPALSLGDLRHTFEVNLFAAAELANWFLEAPARQADAAQPRKALVLVSSMGRWHGMHGSGGYNASKAALSIWGESLEMDLQRTAPGQVTVTIVEPGIFASAMTRQGGPGDWLMASRRKVADSILAAARTGRKSIRPPFWFALLTWGVCIAGRSFRARLFGRMKPGAGPT
jgi:short-subunit dehydrogenase